MKRRVPPGLLPRWKWMATGLLFMGLGVMLVVFLKMQQQTLKLVHHHRHHHSPEFSFLPKSSRQRGENSSKNDGNGDKLAFLFIARHSIPLDILWEHFFLVDHFLPHNHPFAPRWSVVDQGFLFRILRWMTTTGWMPHKK